VWFLERNKKIEEPPSLIKKKWLEWVE